MANPTLPTLNTKTSNLATVCAGTSTSTSLIRASINAGANGTGCSDLYQYSYDNSGIWNPYASNANIVTQGHTRVEIRATRQGCTAGANCPDPGYNAIASWDVVSQPSPPTLAFKTPSVNSICNGELASAEFFAGTGGTGCTDSYRYQWDGAGAWTAYVPGTQLNTTGHNFLTIQ